MDDCQRYDCREDREEIKRHHSDFLKIQEILDDDSSNDELRLSAIRRVVG